MIFTNQALALFPPSLGQAIAQTQRDRDELVEEICCRIGRPPVLLTQENVYPAACRAVLPDDLDYLLERATRASVYAAADQIRQGYLQTAGGCRVGLCGCAYGQAAGQIDGIRQLSSVSVRIPHAVPGCADALVPQLMKDGFCSTLILSPPGGGKTTLLRECVRRLSDQGLRISLMDERGEIAAVQNRTPQFDVGANTDIMTGGQKAACCMMLLRAMRPDVLAFDEISAPEDIEAIVKPCGLGHSKARDISACMRMLRDKYNCQVPTTFEELLALPGVGRKSANLIMGDVFGKPAIVTDTHCIRLCNKIGLVDGIKEPQKVEMALWKIIPPEEGSDLCHRFVMHGRAVCNARKPECEKCCLNDLCRYAREQSGADTAQ